MEVRIAEIIGWLKCHREEVEVEFIVYLGALDRRLKGEYGQNDLIALVDCQRYLQNMIRSTARSANEIRVLTAYCATLSELIPATFKETTSPEDMEFLRSTSPTS